MTLFQLEKNQSLIWLESELQLGRIPTTEEFLESLGQDSILRAELIVWFKHLIHIEFLAPYINDSLQEIHVHNCQEITIKYATEIQTISLSLTNEEINYCWKVLALNAKVSWNYKNPFSSFLSLINTHPVRLSLQHPSLDPSNKTKAFIRFHSLKNILSINDFISNKSTNNNLENYLISQIKEKKNILICGSTNSGKTTLLKLLLTETPKSEHLLIIEDTPEIFIDHPKLTHWQGVPFLEEHSQQERSMPALCSYVLRASPDRLILGEIRGAEIVPLLLLLNTGHRGLLTTVHASSAVDGIHRLALLFSLFEKGGKSLDYQSVMKFLCKQIQLVIYLKNQKIEEIIEVIGADQGQCIYEQISLDHSN